MAPTSSVTTLYEGTHVGELGNIKLTHRQTAHTDHSTVSSSSTAVGRWKHIWELESQKRMSAWLVRTARAEYTGFISKCQNVCTEAQELARSCSWVGILST